MPLTSGAWAPAPRSRSWSPTSFRARGSRRRCWRIWQLSQSATGSVLHNLLAAGFTGHVYAVNPAAESVQGLDAHVSVADIPEPVDLAVVAVPAEQVVAVARDCARARVRALVVISSGFAEAGADGAHRQRELLEICRAAGIRIVGPNCLGVLNTAPELRLNATFAPRPALPGSIGFMSQSGGLGIAIIEAAGRLGLGPVVVRIGGQQDRPVRQRHAALLGAGSQHRCRVAVPRVVRQPAEIRSDRAPVRAPQAAAGGEERSLYRRGPRELLSHRGSAVDLGCDDRCAVRAGQG